MLPLLLYGEITRAQIAKMLIFGLEGTTLSQNPKLAETIKRYGLGGVILFGKNFATPAQVRKLTGDLQALSDTTLLIGIDQEGGAVDRLAKLPGFPKTPSAAKMATLPAKSVKARYYQMALRMQRLGINLNFAPVVDLAINPQNPVIVRYGRAYGRDVEKVAQMARYFIDAHRRCGILCTLKHFPGHGSSSQDSHRGFTDVSGSWQRTELQVFEKLISGGYGDLVMSAHIYNARLDPENPATLSYRILHTILRQKLHFEGVVITDDMQMGAIGQNYTLDEAIAGAVNAGADMLLFGNQLARPLDPQEVIERILRLVWAGRIDPARILDANRRIDSLKQKLKTLRERKS